LCVFCADMWDQGRGERYSSPKLNLLNK
jgi:hypothetical protein